MSGPTSKEADMPRRLHDIAHARAGDKGETTNIAVFPYDPSDYDALCEQLTAERVADYFRYLGLTDVQRYEVPTLKGLNFVLHGTRKGGVSAALELDSHGKSLSFVLLAMEIDISSM